MITSILNFFRSWSDIKQFNRLQQAQRTFVFYAEDTHSYMHFEALVHELTHTHQREVCYLTSDPNDPILDTNNPRLHTFYIREGALQIGLFMQLRADLLIMTMPDLETYHIKRSSHYPVHYLYLFHAMVSTHYNYRKAAFDHFDTLFCTGPHQVEEIRKREALYNLPAKNLYEDGYRRLEVLMADVKKHRQSQPEKPDKPTGTTKTVMLAPSWGEHATLELCGEAIIDILLAAGYHLIVRPHPMTTRKNPRLIEKLQNRFSQHTHFQMQLDIRDKASLYDSDILISDWSGISFEFALACERPVLFIDVPKKCLNDEAERLGLEPVERTYRETFGKVVAVDQLDSLPTLIETLCADPEHYVTHIRSVRDDFIFNLNDSLESAAKEIISIADKATKQSKI